MLDVWADFFERFKDSASLSSLAAAWCDGLGCNESAPSDILVRLVGRAPAMFYRKLPDEVLDAAIACPDQMVRLHLADAQKFMDADRWVRLIATEPPGDGSHLGLIPQARRNCRLLTQEELARRAADPDPEVRRRTLWLPRLSVELLGALALDPAPQVRAAVCGYAWLRLAPEQCASLLADPDLSVRKAAGVQAARDRPMSLAEYSALPGLEQARAQGRQVFEHEVAELLVASNNVMVRRRLAREGRLDADLIQTLARDRDHSVRAAVAVRRDVGEDTRAHILAGLPPRTKWDRVEWVEELHDDESAMRHLARSVSVAIRRSVARARSLPADVADALAVDPDSTVRSLLAKYCEQAPESLLLEVARKECYDEPLVLSNPRFPREDLRHHAADPEPGLRRLALEDPASTPSLAESLARDPDPRVRRRAAGDSRLSPATLIAMLEDEPEVRAAAAANPSLPPQSIIRLLSTLKYAREAARNPAIPATAMLTMVTMAEGRVPKTG